MTLHISSCESTGDAEICPRCSQDIMQGHDGCRDPLCPAEWLVHHDGYFEQPEAALRQAHDVQLLAFRQRVIDAARKWRGVTEFLSPHQKFEAETALFATMDDLDAAEAGVYSTKATP